MAEEDKTEEEQRINTIFNRLMGIDLRLGDATNLFKDILEILQDKFVLSQYEKDTLYEKYNIILEKEE